MHIMALPGTVPQVSYAVRVLEATQSNACCGGLSQSDVLQQHLTTAAAGDVLAGYCT